MQEFDLAVIGSGPGGYRAAVLGRLRGLSVAISEKGEWGGCCLNRGCIPKKTWHYSAKLIAAAQGFAQRGIYGELEADLAQSWRHQRAVVRSVQDSYIDYMKRLGITALRGAARFKDAHTLQVEGGGSIRAKHIVIATGSYPYVPENLPLSENKIITTDELFNSPPPPGERVAIVGGGVIGAEFAYILKMLGKEVVWLTQAQPLSNSAFSAPALKLLQTALSRCGVEAQTGARPLKAEPDNKVTLHFSENASINVDWLLLGTGRLPYTVGLGLTEVGVKVNAEGYIETNEFLQTSIPHIYAIGDVIRRQMTANLALADGTAAIANILNPGSVKREDRAVPELIYSALELGRVGLNEDQAEELDLEPAVGFAAFENNPAALGQDDGAGFVRIIADMDSGDFLGGEVVGSDAGELIHLLSQAYGRKDGIKHLGGFYNHPARAEEVLNATETLAAKWGFKEMLW